jgi:hypothetical protein
VLLKNSIIDKEKVKVIVFSVFENGLSFGTVAVIQVVKVHEVHRLMPSIGLWLVTCNLLVKGWLQDTFTFIELVAQVEENLLRLSIFGICRF